MKIMKKEISIITFIVLLIFSCTNNSKNKVATLEIKNENNTELTVVVKKDLSIYEIDRSEIPTIDTFVINEESKILQKNWSGVYKLYIQDQKFKVYLSTDNKVKCIVSVDENEIINVKWDGDLKELNIYLNDRNQLIDKLSENIYKCFQDPLIDFNKVVDSSKKVLDDKLMELTKNDVLSNKTIIEKHTVSNYYFIAKWITAYVKSNKYLKDSIADLLMQKIKDLDLNNPKYLSNNRYNEFLKQECEIRMSEYYENGGYDMTYIMNNPTILYIWRYNLIDSIYSNEEVKKYLRFTEINRMFISNYPNINDSLYQEYLKTKPEEVYINNINKVIKLWSALEKGKPIEDFEYETIDGEKVKLSSFKGKYVILDFWATWCPPCMEVLPYLKKLEETYKNKNIEFISISIDRNRESWVNMVKDKNLKGNCFHMVDIEKTKKFFNISTVPRFLILDDKGNIYNANAPSPSSNGIKEIIESIIK